MVRFTTKQEQFCKEYIIDTNGSKAAIRAGYSSKTAYSIANELLKKPELQQRITELRDERAKRTGIDPDRIIKELSVIAFSNIADVLDVCIKGIDGRRKDEGLSDEELVESVSGSWVCFKDGLSLKDLPRSASAMISEIKQTKDGISVKLHDKLNAIDKLMRHTGMFDKDNQQQKTEVTVDLKGASTEELISRAKAIKDLEVES